MNSPWRASLNKHDSAILAESAKYQPPADVAGKFQYGTAGFRMKSSLLDSVVFRVGLLAAARSRALGGKTIGVMITASHNPPVDNGVKLVDPTGDMLESKWEEFATSLANCTTDDELIKRYYNLLDQNRISLDKTPANVVFARDTRASGSRLVKCLLGALEATQTNYIDMKLATTPQLHYYVRCINSKGTQEEYGEPTEKGYYEKLSTAFRQVMEDTKTHGTLTVDCANGVGGPKLRELMKYLPSKEEGGIDIRVTNDDVHKPDDLNHNCGADYVKTNQQPPPASLAGGRTERYCSYDGDADRIVYYTLDQNEFRLLDGDRIATLAASWIADLVRKTGLSDKIDVGVVQTAYANGASTAYIEKSLKVPVVCVPTGVKHLHHAAQRFGIGVYFEANGHGTVIFSEAAQKAIHTMEFKSPAHRSSLSVLQGLTELINQTVGDAISDMLLVEAILAHKNYTCVEWLRCYTDMPNRLGKVVVKDRNQFVVVPGTAEQKLAQPKGLQERIDKEVAKYKDGRAFVRPSGTEDAVRVYAEAATTAETAGLTNAICSLVHEEGNKAE